jgi:hypothetical protein
MLTEQLLQEIESGQGETLTRAARRLPRSRLDRPVTLGCLFRWITTGVIGPDGQRIHLEAARLAGRWITTPGAIRRFIQSQTQQIDATKPVTNPRSPTDRQRASERAGRALNKIGI